MSTETETLRQILSLQRAYGATLDEEDFAAHEELWTDDAVLEVFGKEHVGPGAIRGFMEKAFTGKHIAGVPSVEIDGSRATAASDFVFFRDTDLALFTAGVYTDEFLEQGSQWRFARRKIEIQFRKRE